MDEERRFEAEAIFEAAIDLPAKEREAFLSARCGDDKKLRALVNQLLADYDSGMGSFLQSPADETSSETIPQDRTQESASIGPYRILETIGEGGMGTVYAAEQTKPVRRQVAIKVIRPGMDSKHAIARFEAERQALALMDHPNIARVLDAGETEQGRLYFVMDLVQGEPITDYCDRHTLSTRERLSLFVQVCHAVQHAHQKGIIHRDLKPSNILVTLTDGKPLPKVIDFGIAKATTAPLTDRTLYTQQGQLIGTPAYMSPEQAEIGPLDVDTRSDIYSLGVVLYELLAGALPFDPETWRRASFAEIQRIIREEEPPKPSTRVSTAGRSPKETAEHHSTDRRTLARQLKGELDWIVLKAMNKDRNRRYETANTLATDIGRYLRDEPVLAGPPSASYRFRKYTKRHKVALAFAATVFLGINLALFESNRQRAKTDAALVETEEARDESEAVTAFLSEMLSSVDPRERGVDVSVREVLDEASKTIGERLEDQPLIEARLRHTIGAVYHQLGAFTDAAKHAARAAEIRSQELGPEHPETLKSLYQLAFAYGMGANRVPPYTERDPTTLLEGVLEKQRQTLGEEHEDVRESTHLLILLYKDQRRYQDAESLASDAIERWGRALGEDAPQVDLLRYALALVHEGQGRYEDAEVLIERVLRHAVSQLAEDHPFVLELKGVLARLYTQTGRFSEAESLLLEVVDARRRIAGAESYWTLHSMWNLADLYARTERHAEAERLYRESIELSSRTRGDEERFTTQAKERLARMFVDQGRYNEAEPLLVRVVEVRRRVQGEEDPSTLNAMHDLGRMYVRQGRYDDAQPLLAETLEIRRRVLGEEHRDTATSMHTLGWMYERQGRFDDAEPLLAGALEIRRRVLGERHPLTLVSLRRLAKAYAGQGRHEEAEKLNLEALALQEETSANENTLAAESP